MIILLIVVISVALYAVIGVRLGRHDIPHHLENLARQWPVTYDPMKYNVKYGWSATEEEIAKGVENRQKAATGWLVKWMFFWPIMSIISGTRVLTGLLGKSVASLDPITQRDQIADQQRRIEELERELEIT